MFVRVDGVVPVTQDHDSVAGLAGRVVDLQDKRGGSAWLRALVLGLALLLNRQFRPNDFQGHQSV